MLMVKESKVNNDSKFFPLYLYRKFSNLPFEVLDSHSELLERFEIEVDKCFNCKSSHIMDEWWFVNDVTVLGS